MCVKCVCFSGLFCCCGVLLKEKKTEKKNRWNNEILICEYTFGSGRYLQ